MSDNTSDPVRIERDLDQTRSRLGDHLSELQDKLSPGQVLDDLMSYFRGSEGAEFGRSLLANVRDNPMPAALTGIGLAWLMASNPHTSSATMSATEGERFGKRGSHYLYGGEDYAATMTRVRDAEQGVTRFLDEAKDDYTARQDEARGQALGLARHAQENTESFATRVRNALAAAQDAVESAASGVRDQVEGAVDAAGNAISSATASAQNAAQGAIRSTTGAISQGGQAASQTSSNLVATLTESPVLLGALGLAAGALLGALLPQSDQEEAALGGIAGQARDAATDLAKEGMERGKRVAQTVGDKVRESAEEHGLTADKTVGQLADAALSGELAGSAKDVVSDVLRTSDEAVRGEVNSSSNSPQQGSTNPG